VKLRDLFGIFMRETQSPANEDVPMFLPTLRHTLVITLLVLMTTSGCARLRVPAFDPSGDRIFSGGQTNVSLPRCEEIIPKPAFHSPGTPPPAPCANAAVPPCGNVPGSVCPAAQIRDRSYMVVMPGRVVAPVGSEVIVVSGICGEGGHYVMRQPLEWMLAPDSVGHIVQVGKNEKMCFLADWLHAKDSKKIDTDFAATRAHTQKQTITRGNDNLKDDVVLGRGQSWVSVMSPTEGASHVTVLAPQEENWDHRRQTATIYWVDAQWLLPPPAIARIDRGEPAILNTSLSRLQGVGPIAGWIVRYEALDGPAALFENGQKVIEVVSDANGHAPASLKRQSAEPGITQVAVQIIRPASHAGDYPRMLVGQGLTNVTWSAPGLVVRPVGPPTAEADQPVNYRVEVANTGDIAATNVVLTYKIPDGCTVHSTNPPAQPFGDRLEWRLGDIPLKQAPRVVDITLSMRLHARYEHCFHAMSVRGDQPVAELQAQGCISTLVNRSALAVRANGPKLAAVGDEIRFEIEIENTSVVPVSNLKVTDAFDAGLEHIRGTPSPMVISDLGTLQPGQKTGVLLTFIVKQPGTLCHRFEITGDGGVVARTEQCVVATPGQPIPRVDIRINGPETLKVGEAGLYIMEVRNNGTANLRNLRITNRYSASLRPDEATEGRKLGRGEIYWELPELVVGDAVKYELKGIAQRIDPNALSVATVMAEPGITQQAQINTRIVSNGETTDVAPVPNAGEGALAPQPGGLKIDILNTQNPVEVGRVFAYQIGIENTLPVSDKSVELYFELPAGLILEKFLGAAEIATSGNGYVITPIAEIRGNERLRPYELRVRAERAGNYRLIVRARSARNPAGVLETEDTSVIAPQ
jgi:uncharacterized repeat protein (TIGR01451 family)